MQERERRQKERETQREKQGKGGREGGREEGRESEREAGRGREREEKRKGINIVIKDIYTCTYTHVHCKYINSILHSQSLAGLSANYTRLGYNR